MQSQLRMLYSKCYLIRARAWGTEGGMTGILLSVPNREQLSVLVMCWHLASSASVLFPQKGLL